MGFDMPDKLTDVYAGIITEHQVWLQRFDGQRLKKWEDLLSSCSEAAICEAETRKLLSDQNIDVYPCEDLSTGGPDFLCSKNGQKFYVEVTCITIDVATQKTTLPSCYLKSSDAQYYRLLTKHIRGELSGKTAQCAKLDLPCVISIGTLHTRAGVLCFKKQACEDILTGTTQITMDVDIRKGHAVSAPYQTTNLEDSAFLRFSKRADGTIEYARNPISAVLLCACGQYPMRVYGLVHPNPSHPFDRSLLSGIEFSKLADGYQNGSMKVEWF
ncbi:MAG: hypothetical protein ABII09_11655 [Planctomycetota bacterium]